MRENKYNVERADKSSATRRRPGGKHLKNKPELLCFSPCCPTDILHYLIQNTIFLILTFLLHVNVTKEPLAIYEHNY